MPSRLTAAAVSPTRPAWRGIMPISVRSAWLMVRTRCTIAPLPDLNFGSMQTLRIKKGSDRSALSAVIPGRAKARTRNLEVPGLVLRTIPERRIRNLRERHRGGRRQERRRVLGHQGSRGASSHQRGEPRRLDARACRGLSGALEGPAVQGWSVEPHLQARNAGALLRDAPKTIR